MYVCIDLLYILNYIYQAFAVQLQEPLTQVIRSQQSHCIKITRAVPSLFYMFQINKCNVTRRVAIFSLMIYYLE